MSEVDTTPPPSPPKARRIALVGIPVLVLMAVLWLGLTAGPPPMDGYGRELFGLWRTRHVAVALALGWSALGLLCAAFGPRARRRFLVASTSFIACWLLLEVAGLIGLVSYPVLLGGGIAEQFGTHRRPGLDVRGTTHEDLAILWNLPRPPVEFRFQTDRHGFRNTPDRESADVYCLGDSFLVAGLVPQPEFLPAQLEQTLHRSVMGVALIGLSPQAERQLLLDAKLPLERRLVLHFLFEGNDLLDSAAWRSGKSNEALPWKERTLLSQLLVHAQLITQPQPAFVERRTGYIGGEAYRFSWLRSSFEGLESELTPIADTLRTLRDEIRAAGGEYAIVLIPNKIRVLGPYCSYPADSEVADWQSHCSPLPAFASAWGAREGVAVLDLTEALRASCQRGQVPWYPADTHWNAIGHRVAAAAIARWPVVVEWTHLVR